MEKEIEKIKNWIKGLLEYVDESNESAKKMDIVCNLINLSWSGSDLVGHSDFFYGNFDAPPRNRRFSIEWGLINGVPEGWSEKSNEEVIQRIESGASVSLKKLDEDADFIANEFEKLKRRTIILFSGISKDAATEIEKFNLRTRIDIFNQYWKRQIITRDSEAIYSGRKIPTHKYYEATASFIIGATEQLNEFLYLIDKVIVQNKAIGQKEQNKDIGGLPMLIKIPSYASIKLRVLILI